MCPRKRGNSRRAVVGSCPYSRASSCGSNIRGAVAGVFGREFEPHDFCGCGTPFPWASTTTIVYHIENQLEEEKNLSEGDRRHLTSQLQALLDVEPSSEPKKIAALQALKNLAPVAWKAALPALQSIATAEMKRALGLPPV
jgi:hypothetical protein